MGKATAIEWTDATWNPVTGCTKISAGCDNCYAARFSERFRGTPGHPFELGFDLTLRPERVSHPVPWTPRLTSLSGAQVAVLLHDPLGIVLFDEPADGVPQLRMLR